MYGPDITLDNNVLNITAFPGDKLTRESLINAYAEFLQYLDSKPGKVIIDLKNISEKDTNSLALVDSCAVLCSRLKIKFVLENYSEDVGGILHKIGFTETYDGVLKSSARHGCKSVFLCVGEFTINFYHEARLFFGFVGEITSVIFASIKNPGKIQWKETFYYMERAGVDAVPIVTLICFLMGGILAYQGVVQMGKFGLSIYAANLVGLSITKELGAVMVAMICIGRAGSAFAAEIGSMKVAEEIDAMSTMGLRTTRFLVMPKLIALVVVMPLLTLVGDVAGVLGGMLVGILKSGVTLQQYYGNTIHALNFECIMEGVVKSIVFAVLIAGIGCLKGYEADNDAKGVGNAATSAVVGGIFLIVIADAFLTTLFN